MHPSLFWYPPYLTFAFFSNHPLQPMKVPRRVTSIYKEIILGECYKLWCIHPHVHIS